MVRNALKLSVFFLAAALAGCMTARTAQRSQPGDVQAVAPVAPPAPAEVAPPGQATPPAESAPAPAQGPIDPAREQPRERRSADVFAEAVAAFDAGKYDEAASGFVRALELSPDDVNAQYNLGVIAEHQRDLGRAQEAYEAAHRLDPGHVPTLLNLGLVYRRQGQLERAVALYEKVLTAPGKEHDVALLNNLTTAYRLAKSYPKAEATARKVLSRNPDNAEAHKNLALIYFDQGNFRLAELVGITARKLNDKDPGIHNNLGLVYLKMNDRTRALAAFRKAVSLDDAFVPGHLNIGALALAHRDYETAARSFAKVVALDPSSYEAHLYYAYALDGAKARDSKKGIEAGAAYEKALALRTDDAEAVCGAGWAYGADREGWDKAVPFLERCKGLSAPEDQQKIEARLKTIAAMKASAPPLGAQGATKQVPAPAPEGGSMLDKAAEEAAKQEGVPADPASVPPAEPASPAEPAAGANSEPAPEGQPAAPAPEERPGT